MTAYRLSLRARQEYFDAFTYIENFSPRAALKWQQRMLDTFDHLSKWPSSGMLRSELGPASIRLWVEADYVVLYDPAQSPLTIISILHGTQDLASLIAKEMAHYASEEEND